MSVERMQSDDTFIPIIGPDGRTTGIIARDVAEALASTEPRPTQATLDALFIQTTRVRYLGHRRDGQNFYVDVPLVDTANPASIAALAESLRIREGSDSHIMTGADRLLEFSDGERTVAEIGVIESTILRWVEWSGDASLKDARLFVEWLATQGVPEPRREYLERQVEQQRAADEAGRAERRWLDAMPHCLRQFWDRDLWPDDGNETRPIEPLVDELVMAYPQEFDRALTLLCWFGAGLGPWSDYPIHEVTAERLLLMLPTTTIIDAARLKISNAAVAESAARLFCGWRFREQRPNDVRALPNDLRQALLIHSEKVSSAREHLLRSNLVWPLTKQTSTEGVARPAAALNVR